MQAIYSATKSCCKVNAIAHAIKHVGRFRGSARTNHSNTWNHRCDRLLLHQHRSRLVQAPRVRQHTSSCSPFIGPFQTRFVVATVKESRSRLDSQFSAGAQRKGTVELLHPITQETVWHRFLDKELPTLSWIATFSYLGVGTRVLLTDFASAIGPEQSTQLLTMLGPNFFLANAFGCFVMGFAVRSRDVLAKRLSSGLLTGITTGFCGCCTTYASWNLFVAQQAADGQWMNAASSAFVQLSTALVSFYGGYHASEGFIKFMAKRSTESLARPIADLSRLDAHVKRNINQLRLTKPHTLQQTTGSRVKVLVSSLSTTSNRIQDLLHSMQHEATREKKTLSRLAKHRGTMVFALSALLLWAFPMVSGQQDTSAVGHAEAGRLALCCAPLGAWLRYYLSLFNSRPLCQNFPAFTFVANVGASILSSGAEIVGSAATVAGSSSSAMFQIWGRGAFMTGFLGSLSTVSTWVNEMNALASKRAFLAYRYGLVTLASSLVCSAVMLRGWSTDRQEAIVRDPEASNTRLPTESTKRFGDI